MAIGYTMLYYSYILWQAQAVKPKKSLLVDLAFCKAFNVETDVFSGREMHKICIGSIHFWFFIWWCSIIFNHKGLFCQRFLKQNGWFVMISMSVISKHVGSSAHITKQA